jgi:hypothetical protein
VGRQCNGALASPFSSVVPGSSSRFASSAAFTRPIAGALSRIERTQWQRIDLRDQLSTLNRIATTKSDPSQTPGNWRSNHIAVTYTVFPSPSTVTVIASRETAATSTFVGVGRSHIVNKKGG